SIPEVGEFFSGVLVDAPCSCSGTWRRAPDLRWHITPEKIDYYSNIQFGILSLVAEKVRQQGVLVYATCSLFKEENEQVIDRFLKLNPGFSLQALTCPFSKRKVMGGLNFQPPEIDGNSMFVARMIRQ
ncbi:RsmB/NOP family class I SAM-dependent RNA methyltransferase, partial [bacterium]|nr:RsmB/NOP family class I SAM-dependent RNA methyltransferase [bacterium]